MPSGPIRHRRVEDAPLASGIGLEHRSGLNVEVVLAGLLVLALGVLVGNRHRQPFPQFRDRRIDWRRVSELGEDDQAHGEKRRARRQRPRRSWPACGLVLTAMCCRSTGLVRSVWQAAAAYLIGSIVTKFPVLSSSSKGLRMFELPVPLNWELATQNCQYFLA